MRVIAGSAKGIRLVRAPAGVRPMSDRAREGVFSSLSEEVPGARVLDLYAGTGALGIEALSRGASRAVFVDRSSLATRAIRENLARTGLADRARVVRSDAGRFLARPGSVQAFDLVFADPPYDLPGEDLAPVLRALASDHLLSEGSTVVLTRGSKSSTVVIPVHWIVARQLAYGDSVLTLFRSRNLEV